MSSQKYNKVKGSRFESDIADHLNESGMKARRLPRAGSKDIGDVAVHASVFDIVMEAKNVRNPWGSMKQFLREADVEADHYFDKYDVSTIPVVVTKTRQAGPGEGRVVMTVDTFIHLLRWAGLS